jgi:dolichyl-phosphate beta-glucosyltransferase
LVKGNHLPDCFLSLVIPVYNEEKRLPNTLTSLFAFLEQQTYTYEVLVVENGSDDRTLEIAQKFAELYPALRVLKEKERGKGRAVKRGMLEALGKYCFMSDVDFSMPVDEINRFLPPILSDFDIAIASREAPGSKRYDEPLYRHIVGRIFNFFIRWIALPGLHDTQCGFKCFRAAVVKDIINYQTISGWTFDVELIYIAQKRGYRIIEIPIPWHFNPESKIRVLHDSLKMILDLFSVRLKAQQGLYDVKK